MTGFLPVSGVFELSFAESLQPLSRMAPINKKIRIFKGSCSGALPFHDDISPFKNLKWLT